MREDYPLFVHWYETLDWILTCVENFPKNARFSLASRIADESLDVIENVIEAIYSKDRLTRLNRINLSLEKLRVFFRISHKRAYVSTRQYRFISENIDKAGRMTGGWRKRLLEKGKRTS